MRQNLIAFSFFIINTFSYCCKAQDCDATQSLSSGQEIEINSLVVELAAALEDENFSSIDNINNALKKAFGTEGGQPSSIETYYNLIETNSWLSLTNALNLSRELISADSLVYIDLWKMAKGMAPPAYEPHSLFLRAGAEIASGLLKMADKETDATRKTLYQNWATQALDSLATKQLPNGSFPFPDLRTYGDPVFSEIIQNYLDALGDDSVLVLIDGWIIDDSNTGEFKFDAGVIGNAYYEAYNYTGNIQYKEIAIAVADYLKPLKMNVNYNYNSFVALGLHAGYQLTGDTSYLNRSIINLRYGLAPGQLESGKWVDGHNAYNRYHNLIIANTINSINEMPEANLYYEEIASMIDLAIQNLVNQTNTCASSTGFRWLMEAYLLDSAILSETTKEAVSNLIGRHINQADINGKYLDVPTIGQYLELLSLLPTPVNDSNYIQINANIIPNPCTDQTALFFELNESQNLIISIYNISGQLLNTIESGFTLKGTYKYDVNTSIFPDGVYFVNLQTETATYSVPLIKQ